MAPTFPQCTRCAGTTARIPDRLLQFHNRFAALRHRIDRIVTGLSVFIGLLVKSDSPLTLPVCPRRVQALTYRLRHKSVGLNRYARDQRAFRQGRGKDRCTTAFGFNDDPMTIRAAPARILWFVARLMTVFSTFSRLFFHTGFKHIARPASTAPFALRCSFESVVGGNLCVSPKRVRSFDSLFLLLRRTDFAVDSASTGKLA